MINLIWAMDENWLVGNNDKLPWHFPKDLTYFKNVTKDKIVLMGDLTYESMKGYYKTKPFPFKKIYVANLIDKVYEDAILVKDVNHFLKNNNEEIFVIGGPTIYNLALPYADRLYITFVLGRFEGNRYFKKFDLNDYQLVNYSNTDSLIFATYERRKH
ncbi:dihydrofolate reductase [Haploplasma axanthum]|uniref:dihydrofolate reductase n=1 Tax=Haploplasma axanthum TaxID=29552 RepID=A0A449BEG1_HAPAX|nr:dihydrofolate reductase [Haploplasma axanthum]VEU80815.1 Dihydrofolate reductase [Haploplasma axanthum]